MTKRVITNTNRDFKGLWMPASVWLDNDLSITEAVVISEIWHMQTDDNFNPVNATNRYFANFLGLSTHHAGEVVRRLIDKKKVVATYEVDEYLGSTRKLRINEIGGTYFE